MANDATFTFTALDQRATGSITYGVPVAAVKATGTVTVVDYLKAILTAATGSITYGAPDDGDTVIVNGDTFTKVAAAPGAGEFSTIGELEALVEAVTGVNSSENGTVVSITAATPGAAGNAITLALGGGNTGTMAISGATLTGGYEHLTITVDGNALVQGTDFDAETSNEVTATNIAAAIEALGGVGAAAVGTVVTVTNDAFGTAGNSKNLLTSSTAAATVSGATLLGGVNGDTVVVNGTTLTCVNAGPGAGQFTTIAELNTLVSAIANINSSQASGVVTIYADVPGTAGNAYTLALGGSNAGTMAVSGATLTGGVAQTYTDPFLVDPEYNAIFAYLDVDTLAGSSPTLDITPEVSMDKNGDYQQAENDSETGVAFAQMTAAGQDQQKIVNPLTWVRFKVVLGGTNPLFTGTLKVLAKTI